MRHSCKLFALLLMLSTTFAAKQKTSTGVTAKSTSQAKAHADTAAKSADLPTNLPTEEEVNAFLQAQIGWDVQSTWKIVSIKHSKAAGLAEENERITTPQGKVGQNIFVSAEGSNAGLEY